MLRFFYHSNEFRITNILVSSDFLWGRGLPRYLQLKVDIGTVLYGLVGANNGLGVVDVTA